MKPTMLTTQQKQEIVALRKQGFTFQSIANRYGVSRQRIEQIYHYKSALGGTPLYGLSLRAANCVRRMKLTTRDQIAAAIISGDLYPHNPACWGYGRTTHNEIRQWLNLTKELPQPRPPYKTNPRLQSLAARIVALEKTVEELKSQIDCQQTMLTNP